MRPRRRPPRPAPRKWLDSASGFGFVVAGFQIELVGVHFRILARATRPGLAVETPVRRRRKPSLGVLQRRTKNEADRLTEILKAMLDLDRNAARQTIDALVTQFTDLFDETSGAVIGRTRSRPRAPARTRDNLPMAA